MDSSYNMIYNDWIVRFVAKELYNNDSNCSLLGWYQYGMEDYKTRIMQILLGSNDEEDGGRLISLHECSELLLDYVREMRPHDTHFHTEFIRFVSDILIREMSDETESIRMDKFVRSVEAIGDIVMELIDINTKDSLRSLNDSN